MKFVITIDEKFDEENNTYCSSSNCSCGLTEDVKGFEDRLESHIEQLSEGFFTEIDDVHEKMVEN